MLRMLRYLLISLIVTLTWLQGISQVPNACSYKPPREGENWCFYNNLRLQFRDGNVTCSILPGNMGMVNNSSTISDRDGNLLYYSNGVTLWSGDSYIVTQAMEGYATCSQTSLIVPNPAENGIYYIFTVYPPYQTDQPVIKGLNYSILDRSNPADTLPEKKLLNTNSEKITGVRHSNGKDYWVVAHEYDNDKFYSFRVTSNGVDSIDVVSSVGTVHQGVPASRNSGGAMKLSPDGNRLAVAIMGLKMIEWFDFDAGTGRISNVRQIIAPDGGYTNAIEFSPDSRYLYFKTIQNFSNGVGNLYQVDLDAGTPPLLLNSLPLDITSLQLAVDGKIYASRIGKGYLGVIENPNRPDTACNYNEQGLYLQGNFTRNGLTNLIQSYVNIPDVIYDTKCEGDDTFFRITNTANIDSVTWNFGDPVTGAANTDNLLEPSHIFSAPGDYNVVLTEYFENRSFNTNFSVHINPLPPRCFIKPPDSIPMLPGSAVALTSLDYMASYYWNTGETSQSVTVKEPGDYFVTYIDTNCCQQMDTTRIYLLDLFVPNAFSPNYDGRNDRFHVTGPTLGINDYHFYIYNRWGQLLWESDNFNDGWDGTFKGTECPVGTYAWVMNFSVSGNLLNKDKVIKRGVLTLVK